MASMRLLRSLVPSALLLDPLTACRSLAAMGSVVAHTSSSPASQNPSHNVANGFSSAAAAASSSRDAGLATAGDLKSASDGIGSGSPSTSPQTAEFGEVPRSEPWLYSFTELPPDTTAARLSDETKENMWMLHRKDPGQWSVARLAREYRIRQQRVHAILWLKDLEKKMEEEKGEPLDDTISKEFEKAHGSYPRAVNERHVRVYPSESVDALPEGPDRVTALLQESEREERWKVDEFVKRMEFNKKQIPGGPITVHSLDRSRPPAGWSYLVEELGEAGRRGTKGGYRYVAEPGGRRRGLSLLEKEFMERETSRRRRRLIPR